MMMMMMMLIFLSHFSFPTTAIILTPFIHTYLISSLFSRSTFFQASSMLFSSLCLLHASSLFLFLCLADENCIAEEMRRKHTEERKKHWKERNEDKVKWERTRVHARWSQTKKNSSCDSEEKINFPFTQLESWLKKNKNKKNHLYLRWRMNTCSRMSWETTGR